jgi:hypothetical protein
MKLRQLLAGPWYRLLRRVGPMGVASIGLLASALVLVLWSIQLDRQHMALQLAIKTRTLNQAERLNEPKVQPIPLNRQIDDFVAAFPPLSQNADDLRQVFESARRHNLLLLRGDYQFKDEVDAPLVTLTATFPISAAYGPTKEFVADILRSMAHVSMDELRMARGIATARTLETSISFIFVYRRI